MDGMISPATHHGAITGSRAALNGALPAVTTEAFARDTNARPYQFPHRLAAAASFDIPALVALSRRLPADPEWVFWSNGSVEVTDRWEKNPVRATLQETIAGIARNDSLVILKHTEQDPVFGPALRDFLARAIDLAGPAMRRDVIVGEALIIISSPNRITSYHIDAEANFLLQVVGDKTLRVYDQTDRTLLSDPELERFYAGDYSAATYRADRLSDATTFDLRAGTGAHIPSTAPHWVQNGNHVSVAVSINYELRSVARLALQYRANHLIRRAGLSPQPPRAGGAAPLRTVAAQGLAALRTLRRAARRRRYAVWAPQAD